jgi:hypothetical protein
MQEEIKEFYQNDVLHVIIIQLISDKEPTVRNKVEDLLKEILILNIE